MTEPQIASAWQAARRVLSAFRFPQMIFHFLGSHSVPLPVDKNEGWRDAVRRVWREWCRHLIYHAIVFWAPKSFFLSVNGQKSMLLRAQLCPGLALALLVPTLSFDTHSL